ncbi:ribokinase [Clostridium hydrogeniformans]|uniref:ribokinase n=1 Tax=Clostridium hydrogeniformans TaxID=349933 RepID=UPI000489758B|nr:ribokinase [Clostridium hydrogeniformans]
MKVVVIGSINVDYCVNLNRLPKKGETLMAKDFNIYPGGKGANQAVAASRLGGEVSLIGAVGEESDGKWMKELLIKDGINIEGVKEVSKPTGKAFINITDDRDNRIIVYPGANESVTTSHVKGNEEIIKNSDILLTQLEIPIDTVIYSIKLAKSLGKKVILNPAPVRDLPQDIYKYIDIITPNETELYELIGMEDIEGGARNLLERGAKAVIVTLGEKGCMYFSNDEVKGHEAFKIEAVDPTAAGDTFNAAITINIDKDMKEAITFAKAAGALATTKHGAQSSIPTKEEVEEFLKIRE